VVSVSRGREVWGCTIVLWADGRVWGAVSLVIVKGCERYLCLHHNNSTSIGEAFFLKESLRF
jgi:hypothetical protein